MTIDLHALLEKNPVTKKMLQPKFRYKFLGPFNPLDDFNNNLFNFYMINRLAIFINTMTPQKIF